MPEPPESIDLLPGFLTWRRLAFASGLFLLGPVVLGVITEKFGKVFLVWWLLPLSIAALSLIVFGAWNTSILVLLRRRPLVGLSVVLLLLVTLLVTTFFLHRLELETAAQESKTVTSETVADPQHSTADPETDNRIKILYGGIISPDSSKYGLSEIVQSKISAAIQEDNRVSISDVVISAPVTAREAENLLEANNGEALIVGRYFVNESNVRINIEIYVRGYLSKNIGFDERTFTPAILTNSLISVDDTVRLEQFKIQDDVANLLEQFVYFILGNIYSGNGYSEEALHYFERALKAPGEFAVDLIYSGRAGVNAGRGEHFAAIEDLTRAIELNKENWTYRVDRAVAHFNTQEYSKALEDATDAIRLNPHADAAWEIRGAVRFLQREYEAAKRDFVKARQVNSENWTALARLSSLDSETGNFREGIQSLTYILHSNAGESLKRAAKLNRSADYLEVRELALAKSDIDDLLASSLDEEDLISALTNRAAFYALTDQPQLQISDYSRILTLQPSRARTWFQLAGALRMLNRNQEALNAIDQAIQIVSKASEQKPDDVDIRSTLSLLRHVRHETFLSLYNFIGALEDLNFNLKSDPNNSYFYLGRCKVTFEHSYFAFTESTSTELLRAALADCRIAVRLSPQNWIGWLQLAGVLISLSELEEAARILIQLSVVPELKSFVYLRLAELEYFKGEYTLAIGFLVKAMKASPDFASADLILRTAKEIRKHLLIGVRPRARLFSLQSRNLRDIAHFAYPLVHEEFEINWNEVVKWKL